MLGYSECEAISGLLWNYAAQRVTEEQSQRIETHILVCSSCRKEAAAYRQAVGALGTLKRSPIPESRATWRDLEARLTAQPARRPLFAMGSWRLPSLAWGSLAVASVLGVFFFGRPVVQNGGIPHPSNAEIAAGTPSGTQDSAVENNLDGGFDDTVDNELDSFTTADVSAGKRSFPRNRSNFGRHAPHNVIHWASVTASGSSARQGHSARRHVLAAAPDYDAVDGGRSSGSADNENFVLAPVSSATESEMPSNYVMGSVSTAVRPVSSTYDADATEAHGW